MTTVLAVRCFMAVRSALNFTMLLVNMLFFFFRFHYYGSFGAGALFSCIGFFFVLFTFKETEKTITEKSEKNPRITSLDNLLCSFKCLFKKRSEGMRHIVILLVSCMVVS